MGLPGHLQPREPGKGRGPFGEKGFRAGLIGCAALVAIGLLMMLLGGEDTRSVGISLLVLGAFGLVVGGAGLLLERFLEQRRS
jgi:hypothetical protein